MAETETERDIRRILEEASRLIRNIRTSRRCAGSCLGRDLARDAAEARRIGTAPVDRAQLKNTQK